MSGAVAVTGITARLHRFEVVAVALLAVLGVAATILVSAQLDGVGWTGACDDAMRRGMSMPRDCEFKINEFYGIVSSRGWIVTGLTGFVPLVAAVLLGVAVVGRELERGTTRLAWALAPSRLRWFAHRFLPVLVFVAVASLVLGAAADRWLAASEPGVDPANALLQVGQRGPVLAARAVFVLVIALLVGAVMGRALPAVLVAGVIATVGIAGGSYVHAKWIASEAIVIDEAAMTRGDLFIDQRFRLPDGSLIGWDEVERYEPPPTEWEEDTIWPTLPSVAIGVPGTLYGEIALREIAALSAGSLVALALTVTVIQRRRPG